MAMAQEYIQVCCPYTRAFANKVGDEGMLSFSASKVVTMTFYPKEPVPATFNIRCGRS